MLETHARLRDARASEEGDPIEPVAEAIAAEARLLCFDEMQVNNPADAMILSRLFARLLERGRQGRHHLQPPAARPLQGRAQPRAVPAVHRPDRAARCWWSRSTARPTIGSTGWQGVEAWHVPNGPEATAALCPGLLPADRLSGRGPRQGAERGARCRRRADAARAQEPQGRRGLLVQAAVRRERAAPPIISPSPAAFTP